MPSAKIGLWGASGRMGLALVRLLSVSGEAASLSVGVVSRRSGSLGKDLGTLAGIAPVGVLATVPDESALDQADVFVDFSCAEGTAECLDVCKRYAKPVVVATTGLGPSEVSLLHGVSRVVPVVHAPNTSIGAAALQMLAERASCLLRDWDVGIREIHHKHKRDEPSGTALLVREALSAGHAAACSVSSLRVGQVIGEHEIMFCCGAETMIIRHSVGSRDVFASGALAAARWLICAKSSMKRGLFSMGDVLGMHS